MKTRRIVVTAMCAIVCAWGLTLSAEAQRSNSQMESLFNLQYLRVVYGTNLFTTDPIARDRLSQMNTSGANTVILGSWSSDELSVFLSKMRADPILSRYKVILGIGGPIYDAWIACLRNVSCNEDVGLSGNLQSFLDRVVALALLNQDMVVGYYTFDEPSLQSPPELNGKMGISKYYQEHVYEYIRAKDPDSGRRPVILANTMWGPGSIIDDATIDRAMSIGAQDIIFIDQYANDQYIQNEWLKKWKAHGLLSDPIVFVLPAFSQTTCPDPNTSDLVAFSEMLGNVWKDTLDSGQAHQFGYAYFAFWPGSKTEHGFKYAIDNCAPIFNAVVSHLQTLPSLPPELKLYLPFVVR